MRPKPLMAMVVIIFCMEWSFETVCCLRRKRLFRRGGGIVHGCADPSTPLSGDGNGLWTQIAEVFSRSQAAKDSSEISPAARAR